MQPVPRLRRFVATTASLGAVAALLATALGGPIGTLAASSTIDPGFGAGFRNYDFRGTSDTNTGVEVRSPNGQIVIGGTSQRANPVGPDAIDVVFTQVLSNGRPDNGFGDHGKVLVTLPTGARLVDFALESDGSIVGLAASSSDLRVFRLEANGSPDLDFGTGGSQTVTLAAGQALDHIAVQPDHRIILAGRVLVSSHFETLVRRLTSDGDFEADVTTLLGTSSSLAADVAVSKNGSFIGVANSVDNDGSGHQVIGVLLLDASSFHPAAGFGDAAGRALLSGSQNLDASAIFVGGAGGVVVDGDTIGSPTRAVIGRLKPNGSPDPTFDSDGKAFFSIPNLGSIRSLDLDSSGRFVVTGSIAPDGLIAARYLSNGHLDTTFGTGGRVITAPPAPYTERDAGVAPNGGIVLSGTGSAQGVVRLTAAGKPDQGFHAGGATVYRRQLPTEDVTVAEGVAISPAGLAYLAGRFRQSSGTSMIVMGLTPTGYRNTAFGNIGEAGRAQDTELSDTAARAVALDTSARPIVVGCALCQSAPVFAVVRYTTGGVPDSHFGVGNGTVTTGFSEDASALAVAIDTNGAIVAAGREGSRIAVARYTQDGDPDNSFSGDGKTTLAFTGLAVLAHSVAIQPDHKVIVAGTLFTQSGESFSVARFRANGTLDPTFGTGGRVTTTFSAGQAEASGMALRSDGRIVVVGTINTSGGTKVAMARYLPSGSPDTSFGGTGRIVAALGPGDDAAGAVIADGVLTVVAGTNRNGGANFEVARFASNGTLDGSFNGTGFDLAPMAGSDAEVHAIAITPAGNYLVAGEADDGAGQEVMAAVRFAP